MERIEKLTCKCTDGIITAEEQTELENRIYADSTAHSSYTLFCEMEVQLRCQRTDLDLTKPIMEQIRQSISDRIETGVMKEIQGLAVPLTKEQAVTETAGFSRRWRNRVWKSGWWVASLVFHAACILIAAVWILFNPETVKENFNILEMNTKKKNTFNPTSFMTREPSTDFPKLSADIFMPETPEIDDNLSVEELEVPEIGLNEAIPHQSVVSTIGLEQDGWMGIPDISPEYEHLYRFRTGRKKRMAILRFDGSRETESAVMDSLKWFKKHQRNTGEWSLARYYLECAKTPPCDHIGIEQKNGDENCATGLALLCFLGAGHTPHAGKFRQQVAQGISYLQKRQETDGAFCMTGYQHALATMAVCEAYSMTKDPELRDTAQKAVDTILSRQNMGLGWDYNNPSARNDTSVTGWITMALKSAASAGLDIGTAFEGVRNHLEKVTPGVKGTEKEPVLDGMVAYTYNSDTDKVSTGNVRLTAVGMLCRIFTGEDAREMMLRAHANRMLEYLPGKSKDFYYIYYATLAMFQMGGEYWKQWNEALKKYLLETQRKGGCAHGSWDPYGSYVRRGGRIFSTAIGCLSLEVYYRYLPVSMLK